jgi:3',5'-cyclic AMP phosphodiesterase CpdA
MGRQTPEAAIRLIHITDPHLTDLSALPWRALGGKRWSGYLSWRPPRPVVHPPDPHDHHTPAVRALATGQILVNGDQVHNRRPEEVAAAADWLDALGPPERVTLVPGNHDVYARDSWGEVSVIVLDT